MTARSIPAFTLTICVAAGLIAGPRARAGDWPQWRGPQRNGVSQERGLLQSWPKEGPKLLWQVHGIGDGYSTPSVVGDRLYLLSNKGLKDEFVQALSARDGKPIWSVRIGKVGNPDQMPNYPAARSTPTVDGALLYALGSDGDLVCLATATGKVRWRKSLRADFGGQPGTWAYAESPLVDGNAVICSPGGATATMVALNKKTGAVIWKSAIPGGDAAGYASAIVVEAGGVRQYVQFMQKGVVGVDAKTGKYLWRYDETAQGSPANMLTPVAYGEYVFSASRRSCGLVKVVKSDGGSIKAEQVYQASRMPNGIGGAVRVGDSLYGAGGASLICANFATGETKWQDRGLGAGSVLFADGRLYMHGENGDVLLVEATPEAYREKGRFTLPGQPDRGGSQAWTYPVIANGRLYLRDLGVLWCYDLRDPKGPVKGKQGVSKPA